MNKYSSNYQILIESYKEFHEKGIHGLKPDQTFSGSSLHRWIPKIAEIIKKNDITSIIDFGCGKAIAYKEKIKLIPKIREGEERKKIIEIDITELWGVKDIFLYDPAVKKHQQYPQQKKDLLICVDVIEHIPYEDTYNFIDDLFALSKKFIFLVISVRPAKRKFHNGQNLHINLRTEKEWTEILKMFYEKYPNINYFLGFN